MFAAGLIMAVASFIAAPWRQHGRIGIWAARLFGVGTGLMLVSIVIAAWRWLP